MFSHTHTQSPIGIQYVSTTVDTSQMTVFLPSESTVDVNVNSSLVPTQLDPTQPD